MARIWSSQELCQTHAKEAIVCLMLHCQLDSSIGVYNGSRLGVGVSCAKKNPGKVKSDAFDGSGDMAMSQYRRL
jgi:hypothetical protein